MHAIQKGFGQLVPKYQAMPGKTSPESHYSKSRKRQNWWLVNIKTHRLNRLLAITTSSDRIFEGTKIFSAPILHGIAPISLLGLVGGTMAAALLLLCDLHVVVAHVVQYVL